MVNVKLTDFKKEMKKQMEENKMTNKKNITEEEIETIMALRIIEEFECVLNLDDDYIEESYGIEHLGTILEELEYTDYPLGVIENNMPKPIIDEMIRKYLLNGKEIDYATIENIYSKLNPEELYFDKYKMNTSTAFVRNSVKILKFLLKEAGLEIDKNEDELTRDILLEEEFKEPDPEQEEIEKDIEKQLSIDKNKKKLKF